MTFQRKKLEKLLVANRGEIAIRIMRAGSELKLTTVGVYTHEDRYSLHRYKADEAYQIGAADDPLKPYLDIEGIIALAKREGIDAIHPGYGFLSENVELAKRCEQEGIIFVGPRPDVMEALGDKVRAKIVARRANVPVIEDSQIELNTAEEALSEAKRIGFPVLIKAAAGGGGRGMRAVLSEDQLVKAFGEAKNEAAKAFGDDTVFIEKYIQNPKHIEVQILADNYGNIVHLYERDCSVQRRFQKVIEVAPAPSLSDEAKARLYEYALRIAREVNYNNAGTVEFLVDADENIYFIEVNPRIQVEHTITEEITQVDIVRTQILVAQGYPLSDPFVNIPTQESVKVLGWAIQCRITTEDPENGFKPDFGTIIAYRNAAGFGIRLDEGSSYPGVKISPFFDSMLVKVSASGRTLYGTTLRLMRALREFRVRGVKTNIGFLENVIGHPDFLAGKCTVRFIDDNPDLLKIPAKQDRATRLLRFLGDVSVNGNPDVPQVIPAPSFITPKLPFVPLVEPPIGTKQILEQHGTNGLMNWLKANNQVLFTDTTLRDAHQSLLATRVRTHDMLEPARAMAHFAPNLFSMEVWGGATFDVALRFLHEDPWQRLEKIRAAVPNVLLQMLFRGSNAVGYTSYPNNLIEAFIEKAAETGIDVFRIFDSLNWVEQLKPSIKAVRERTKSIAEAAICYTNDLQNPNERKYTLSYYVTLAKQLEDAGAHMLAIKDMAGLLKPHAAEMLIGELKKNITIPIHLHTHDTAGIQNTTYLKAIEAGVDVVDVALGGLSGLTSQPNFNSLVASLNGNPKVGDYNLNGLNALSNYWEDLREVYSPFESGLKASTAEVYEHQIPGGQYSNLRPQAKSLGLLDQFDTIKKNYIVANRLLGDIVKVTPSSKIVGDLALFMTSNNLTETDIFEKGQTLSFPESVKGMLRGDLGQTPGGFNPALSKIVLKDEKPYTGLPNDRLKPIELEKEFVEFAAKFPLKATFTDFLSYKMYPKVFEEFYEFFLSFGEVWNVTSREFFYGMNDGDEIEVVIAAGKTVIIKKVNTSTEVDEDGMRTVGFELNGQMRKVKVRDRNVKVTKIAHRKASAEGEIGSPLQGKLATVNVKLGDDVKVNTPLFTVEAMKMETTIAAHKAGKIKDIVLKAGTLVEQDDLVIVIE
jgi:pyruvate carboxylase